MKQFTTYKDGTSGTLLTARELQARWKKCRMTLYRWIKSGDLPALKIGRDVRFRPEDVDAFERRAQL